MTDPIDYEQLYRDVIPSVVSIYVSHRGLGVSSGSGFVTDVATTGSERLESSASGTPYVVTNQHVVGDADLVELRFHDGQWREGRVVGTDVYTDLAVVAVDDFPADATPLPVADENSRPGRPVAALGNPLGLDGSITVGIVSGANRSMPTSNGFAIPDVVQTDAPINPGNSGGPLVALRDGASRGRGGDPTDDTLSGLAYEVVGVNRARQGDNIGFAISPAIVRRVVPALVDDGRYRHSALRIRTIDVTPTVAEANGIDEPRGVLVVEADRHRGGAGLRGSTRVRRVRGRDIPVGGDVIVGIEGREVRTHEELMRYLITETRPGEPVEIEILRNARPQCLRVMLTGRPTVDGREDSRRGEHIPIE